jgi:TM2 domain-containing membrane protein YozV
MGNTLEYSARKKSLGFAYVAWLVLGLVGAHRFYLGHSESGIGMILMWPAWLLIGPFIHPIGPFIGMALVVWWLIDALLIPKMVERYNVELARSLQNEEL